MEADEWNVKKPGGYGVVSHIPLCGYDAATIASLKKAGYRVYKNGKPYTDPAGSRSKKSEVKK